MFAALADVCWMLDVRIAEFGLWIVDFWGAQAPRLLANAPRVRELKILTTVFCSPSSRFHPRCPGFRFYLATFVSFCREQNGPQSIVCGLWSCGPRQHFSFLACDSRTSRAEASCVGESVVSPRIRTGILAPLIYIERESQFLAGVRWAQFHRPSRIIQLRHADLRYHPVVVSMEPPSTEPQRLFAALCPVPNGWQPDRWQSAGQRCAN